MAETHIHLTDEDLDQWREDVLMGGPEWAAASRAARGLAGAPEAVVVHVNFRDGSGAHPGDVALNDAAIDSLVDWQLAPARRSSLPAFLIFGGGAILYFGGHIVASLMRAAS